MRKKSQKRRKTIAWKGFFLFGAVLIIGMTTLGSGLYGYLQRHLPDTSLTGEEIRDEQTTIPPDVLAERSKEQQRLGASTTTPTKPTFVHVPILIYHYVEYVQDVGDTTRISLNTTPYTLEQEILTLKNAGYSFMTNAEVAKVLDGKMKLPKKPIMLTFDDGYKDFYTDAYPILKKYNVKATQYVISGTSFLNTPNHLTTEELQEIAKDGLVEIGAHTVDHLWLKGLPSNTVIYEVWNSKHTIEQLIHKPVVSFAYPYGAFDTQAIQIVKDGGFTSAVSTIPGIDQFQTDRYFLYRLHPGGRSGDALLSWLASVQNTK